MDSMLALRIYRPSLAIGYRIMTVCAPMPAPAAPLLVLLLVLAAASTAHTPPSPRPEATAGGRRAHPFNRSNYLVWHMTDVHIDPWYTVGADATRCYCEDAATCPQSGKGCSTGATANASAQLLGNSEGNCETRGARDTGVWGVLTFS
jgi:hypothetical protein